MSNSIFQTIGSLSPRRSAFNLSYEKKFTCDMGQLIPIMCDEVVPGDFWQIGNQAVVRMQPLVAPVLHEMNMFVHYFFVPYRLLDEDWEEFITGGEDGQSTATLDEWTPSDTTKGSLWDFMGFPTGVTPHANEMPLAFPRTAYNLVYNEYYRDENFITEKALTQEAILKRCWEKDYFTSSLPWLQRGVAPALPISGSTSAVWQSGAFATGTPSVANNLMTEAAGGDASIYTTSNQAGTNLKAALEKNDIDLSTASTFDIADLRLAFQIQKWMERNARGGARYTEFLASHFGLSPRDERLQRPEYIGGTKSPIIVSEVLQTSESNTTAQGTLAGHGISISDQFAGKYMAKEFGLIIGIMSLMPKPDYQQGINRQWLRKTKYDFFFPEFANLSEQAIKNAEIFVDGTTGDSDIFGYQGRYDEMRTKQNMICSEMRDTFDYWHLSRQFTSTPTLNESFLECNPRKDIFAVPSEDGFIVSFGNRIKAFRPLPVQAEPGLIDHN